MVSRSRKNLQYYKVGQTIVTVTEGMAPGEEIEQHGCFFFYTGIEVHTAEGLIDLPNGALERVVLLVAEERGVTKLLFQHIDFLPDFVIVSPKSLRQRVLLFSDVLPSALFGCKSPCSEVA